MTKAIFLDFDGTFADYGVVPPAHVEAVSRARSAGHRVLLCTGRPRAGLSDEVLAIGFDGLVCAAGAYVEIEGEVLLDRRFPAGLAARMVAVLDAARGSYLLEAPTAMYARPGAVERIARLTGREADFAQVVPHGVLDLDAEPGPVSFAKAVCFVADVPVSELLADLGPGIGCVPISLPGLGDSGGELFMADVHKAGGAELAARALGVPRGDVIAVGDGANDLELLGYAGLAVAIEGSAPELVAVSDRTAPPPSQDGLATLFAELQLV